MNWDFERFNGFVEIGGLVTAVLLWVYRRIIVSSIKWVVSVLRAPGSVADILTILSSLKRDQEDTKLMAQASWDAIEKPVWRSDENGLCVHVNRKFLETLQCQISDALGNSWRSFIHQDDRQRVWKEWDLAVEQKRNFNLRYRWVDKTGHTIWINASASRMSRADGSLAGWVAFVEIETSPITP